jgi:peroxiredoxin
MIGQKAPEFSLGGDDGKTYDLKDFAGKKSVVLIFYCMNDTPG